MKSSSIDTVLEVRLRHEPGTLARLAAAIAGEGGLLCEIETLRVGDEHTLREILLALSNPDPEIDPTVALAAGAALASDGHATNNALAFPGLMRGAIDGVIKHARKTGMAGTAAP